MDKREGFCAPESPTGPAPQLTGVSASAGIMLKEQIFLPSLPPCCAQFALPYWAKIAGTVVNTSPEDRLVTVAVALLDEGGRSIEVYSDTVAVDAGEESTFEVKLMESRDRTAAYTMSVGEYDPHDSAGSA